MSRSENGSVEIRQDYRARLEVRSGTYSYIKQLHRNAADAAIQPVRTSYLGNSQMPDTLCLKNGASYIHEARCCVEAMAL